MISNTTKSHRETLTDIVTYRYNGVLVYVPVAPNYNEALSYARKAFPKLQKLPDASLSFSLTSSGHTQGFVGISALAWPKLISHMSRYQIIDVHVTQTHERDDAEAVEGTEPLPTLRPGRWNWFFRKLRTTARQEYGRSTALSIVPQRSASHPISTTSANFSYDCRVYADSPSETSSLVV